MLDLPTLPVLCVISVIKENLECKPWWYKQNFRHLSNNIASAHTRLHLSHLMKLSHFSLLVESQQKDTTFAMVYIHFEENQCWTNHGAELIEEHLPFADVSKYFYLW